MAPPLAPSYVAHVRQALARHGVCLRGFNPKVVPVFGYGLSALVGLVTFLPDADVQITDHVRELAALARRLGMTGAQFEAIAADLRWAIPPALEATAMPRLTWWLAVVARELSNASACLVSGPDAGRPT